MWLVCFPGGCEQRLRRKRRGFSAVQTVLPGKPGSQLWGLWVSPFSRSLCMVEELTFMPQPEVICSLLSTEACAERRVGSAISYLNVLCAQLCLTLCDPMDCSLSGSSVHGILQARILEWAVMPSSRGSSWPRDRPRSLASRWTSFTGWVLCSTTLGINCILTLLSNMKRALSYY